MPNHRVLRSLPWLLLPSVIVVLGACGNDAQPGRSGICRTGGLLTGDLVISEFMANNQGKENDDSHEWLEIYNATQEELDLQGLLLLHSKVDTTDAEIHEVGRSWVVPAHGYGVAGFVTDAEADIVSYIDYGYGDALGAMRSTKGRLVVTCADREDPIDEITYDDAVTGEQVDGIAWGFSGHVAPDAILNDTRTSWCGAFTEFDVGLQENSRGTPGARNDVCYTDEAVVCIDGDDSRETTPPSLGDVVITEFMANPTATPDASGTPAALDDETKEWFEVLARTDFDLNGLALGKEPDLSDATPLAINACVPVVAGSWLVFARSDDPALNGGLPVVDAVFDFDLNQGNKQIVSSYRGVLLDQFPYGSTSEGVATSLDPRFLTIEGNDVPGFSCDATTPYGDGELGTPGEANPECTDIVPPEGQCFDGGTLRGVEPPRRAGDLVITEVLPDPSIDDQAGEWLEVRAGAPVDLSGLSLRRVDGSERTTVETAGGACVRLAAGEYAVIAREREPAVNGGLPRVDGTFDFSLRNSDEGLQIDGPVDGGGVPVVIDAITWSTSDSGVALSLDPGAIDPVANDDEANFCAAVDPYGDGNDLGTPGAANPVCGGLPSDTCLDGGTERDIVRPQIGDLVITEVMPDPAAVDDSLGEWFEILVTSDVDLNGLELGDDPANPDAQLPTSGDCLAVGAGERIILARSTDAGQNGGLPPVLATFGFGLVNGGDVLYVGYGGEVLDQITWSGSTPGAALSLDPAAEDPVGNDDEANFCDATQPYGSGDLGTPGTQGSAC